MKNFVRLVRFDLATPISVRSLRGMRGDGRPALFHNSSGWSCRYSRSSSITRIPQCWISSKIDSIEENIVVLNAQVSEVQQIKAAAELGVGQPNGLSEHYRALDQEAGVVEEMLREHQRLVDLPDLKRQSIPNVKHDPAEIDDLKRQQRIVEERLKELSRGSKWLKEGKLASLRYRENEIKDDLKSEEVWLGRYQRLKPLIYRYIPSDSFRNLLLLLGLVLVGVAIKGFFMFQLQDVLVGPRSHSSACSTLRNLFFRRTMSFSTSRVSPTRARPSSWPGSPTTSTRSARVLTPC